MSVSRTGRHLVSPECWLQCHTLSRWTVDRDRSRQCASGEPVPAPQVAAKVSHVLLSFRLDSPEGAGLLERAEVS